MTKIALIMGKQGSGKTSRVCSGIRRQLGFWNRLQRLLRLLNLSERIHILANYYNHITFDEDGDLAFVTGVRYEKTSHKAKDLKGTYVLEFPHSGYIPPNCNSHLNNHLTMTKIFLLELPESDWKDIGGSTGAMTSPEYFMERGAKYVKRQDCDYQADMARIKADILCSKVPLVCFDKTAAMLEPIRNFLLFSTNSRWTERQLRKFIKLKMGKTPALRYQVIDFGNGIQTKGDTQTLDKLTFIVQNARIPIEGQSFLDLGCNMGSILFELKKRGAGACIGMDVHEPALEVARNINENWFQFDNLHFLNQSIVDDWEKAHFCPTIKGVLKNKADYAFALSVLHKGDVVSRLDQCIQNLANTANNVVVEAPFGPVSDTADWNYNYVMRLLEERFVVEQLVNTDFHSVCKPRALLLCKKRDFSCSAYA